MSARVKLHRRFFDSLLCCAGLFVSSGAAGAELIIENVVVLTPDQRGPAIKQHVRVRDERIVEISSRPLAAKAGVQRIDGRGKFLTPGLMDSHVHVSEPPGFPLGSADPSLAPLMDAYAKQQPRSYLYYGVTQVLDPANTLSAIETFNAQPLHCVV